MLSEWRGGGKKPRFEAVRRRNANYASCLAVGELRDSAVVCPTDSLEAGSKACIEGVTLQHQMGVATRVGCVPPPPLNQGHT